MSYRRADTDLKGRSPCLTADHAASSAAIRLWANKNFPHSLLAGRCLHSLMHLQVSSNPQSSGHVSLVGCVSLNIHLFSRQARLSQVRRRERNLHGQLVDGSCRLQSQYAMVLMLYSQPQVQKHSFGTFDTSFHFPRPTPSQKSLTLGS